MAVIWGLDLKEIQWSKFKSSNMFTKVYHLRRTKMIVYQLAMMICVCSEATGTAALSDYVDQQAAVEKQQPGASVSNNNIVGAASYNIFVGVSVATIFGAAFFFDLFWPERHESKAVRLSWKISAVVVSIMMLSSALTMTIITATKSAYITGTDAETAKTLWKDTGAIIDLKYRVAPKVLASVILAWPGFVATVASTVILFASHRHDDEYGPKSNYGRSLEDGRKDVGPAQGQDEKYPPNGLTSEPLPAA